MFETSRAPAFSHHASAPVEHGNRGARTSLWRHWVSLAEASFWTQLEAAGLGATVILSVGLADFASAACTVQPASLRSARSRCSAQFYDPKFWVSTPRSARDSPRLNTRPLQPRCDACEACAHCGKFGMTEIHAGPGRATGMRLECRDGSIGHAMASARVPLACISNVCVSTERALCRSGSALPEPGS